MPLRRKLRPRATPLAPGTVASAIRGWRRATSPPEGESHQGLSRKLGRQLVAIELLPDRMVFQHRRLSRDHPRGRCGLEGCPWLVARRRRRFSPPQVPATCTRSSFTARARSQPLKGLGRS